MRTLGEVADVIRSKNAGPFVVTFDILFECVKDFEAVRDAGFITRQTVANLYNLSENELLNFGYYPFARGIKFSVRRLVSSGAPGDSDVYGAQQHAPLLTLVALPSETR